MVHNPKARGRAPRYKVNDKERPKGVTTIMGQTLAKDLVQWAVNCCIEFLRGKLPVITEADLKAGASAHTVKRDTGADTGTEAHALVENYLKGRKETEEQPSQEAWNAFKAFEEWFEEAQPEIIGVEEVIYSQLYKYAGTYDCLLKIGDRVCLCDLKTTNPSKKAPKGVYAENFIQLGAYALAHEEQRQYEEENGGTKLVKIDDLVVISAKKDGKLDVVSASEIGFSPEGCGDMFKKVINVHNFLKFGTEVLGGK